MRGIRDGQLRHGGRVRRRINLWHVVLVKESGMERCMAWILNFCLGRTLPRQEIIILRLVEEKVEEDLQKFVSAAERMISLRQVLSGLLVISLDGTGG